MRESRRLPTLKPNPSEAQLPRDSSYIYPIKTKHIVPNTRNHWKTTEKNTWNIPIRRTSTPVLLEYYPRALPTYIQAHIYLLNTKTTTTNNKNKQPHPHQPDYIRTNSRLYPRESTYLFPSDYIRNSFKLHTSPRVSIPVSPRNYVPIPFYLYTYSLLFTLGSYIIDILEKSNYHRDDTNLSSR